MLEKTQTDFLSIDSEGKTAFHWLAIQNHDETFKTLVETIEITPLF
jgi:ankyrin repeat protein